MAPVSETISITVDGKTLPTSEILTGRGFVTGKSGSGKSILEGTPVYTEEGRKPIEDIAPGDRVLSLNRESYKQEFREVRDRIEHEADDLLKITLEDGTELIGTEDHSFLTARDMEIVPVRGDEVEQGTWMPLSRHLPSPGSVQEIDLGEYVTTANNVIVEDEVIRSGGKTGDRYLDLDHTTGRILGLYLAEGSLSSRYVVQITNSDDDVRTFLGENGFKVYEKTCNRAYKPFGEFVEEEFRRGAANKRVPPWVYDAPFEFRAGLLSGYFDGDGTVNDKDVTVISKSPQLLSGIKEILRQFGISTTIRDKMVLYDEEKLEFKRLAVDSFSIESFCEVVDLLIEEKQVKLDQLAETMSTGDRYNSKDQIPNFGKSLNFAVRERGWTKRANENRSKGSSVQAITRKQATGRKNFNRLLDEFDAGGRARAFGNSDIQWKRVATVEPLEGERTVYDLDVECNDNFIANGVFVHNSNSASVIAEELLERGLPLLIVDTDGEYHGLKERYDLHHVGTGDAADTDIDEADPGKIAELGLERNVPIILDVSGVLDADVGADMARRVIEQLFQTGNRVRKPFLVIVEEIHEFLPEAGKRGDISETLLRVAKRGRKRGIGLLGISQRPAAVDKDFITQCDWIVWHRLTWDNDTRVVQRMIGPDYADAVQELETGEAFLMADWDDSIQRVRFRRKRTKDIGATPGLERFEAGELDNSSAGAARETVEEPAEESADGADDPIKLTAEPVEEDEDGKAEPPRWDPWPGHERVEPETPPPPPERPPEGYDPIAEIGHFTRFAVQRMFGSVRAAGRRLDRSVPDPSGEQRPEEAEPLSIEFVAETESPRRALALLLALAVTAVLVAWLLMA